MKQKNITMDTIAKKAGVSITTVSHVINKTRNVSKETKDAVLKTLEELNYKKTKTKKIDKVKNIGVIIADIKQDYYTSIIKAIEIYASKIDVAIIFCNSENDYVKEKNSIKMLINRNISGLILAPIESKTTPPELKNLDIPVVLIDRQYNNHNFLFVGINNLYSSYLGTKYLHNKGSKNIGFIGFSTNLHTINQRVLGYKAFLQEVNNNASQLVLSISDNEDKFSLIKAFIKENCIDGIICATSTACYEVIKVIENLPILEQKNIKIITYDNSKWFDFLKFPISVISQPTAEIGYAAIENLISSIEHQRYNEKVKRELLYNTDIIERV